MGCTARYYLKKLAQLGLVAHTGNPSAWDYRQSEGVRPALSYRETLTCRAATQGSSKTLSKYTIRVN